MAEVIETVDSDIEINEDGPLSTGDLLQEVVMALVDDPNSVSVQETNGGGTTLLLIRTAPGDVGKVLGRQGSTIRTIRELFSKVAAVQGRQAVIEVHDPRAAERRAR